MSPQIGMAIDSNHGEGAQGRGGGTRPLTLLKQKKTVKKHKIQYLPKLSLEVGVRLWVRILGDKGTPPHLAQTRKHAKNYLKIAKFVICLQTMHLSRILIQGVLADPRGCHQISIAAHYK